MNIPTKRQLSPIADDLDGRIVVEHLLGKGVEEAAVLLEENTLAWQEDYTFMGPEAFCFYCPALVRYLASHAAEGNQLFAYGILQTFRLRLDQDGSQIAGAVPCIEAFCAMIETDPGRFGFDENYSARARRRIAEVRSRIAALRESAPIP